MKLKAHISDVKQNANGSVGFNVFFRNEKDTVNIGKAVAGQATAATLVALRIALKAAVLDMVSKLPIEERLRLVAGEIEQDGIIIL